MTTKCQSFKVWDEGLNDPNHKLTIANAKKSFKRSMRPMAIAELKNAHLDPVLLGRTELFRDSQLSVVKSAFESTSIFEAEIYCLFEAYARLTNTCVQDAVFAKNIFHTSFEFFRIVPMLFGKNCIGELKRCRFKQAATLKSQLKKLHHLCSHFLIQYKELRNNSTGHRTANAYEQSLLNKFFQYPFVLEDIMEIMAQLAKTRRILFEELLLMREQNK